jgi:hypothetical protein
LGLIYAGLAVRVTKTGPRGDLGQPLGGHRGGQKREAYFTKRLRGEVVNHVM